MSRRLAAFLVLGVGVGAGLAQSPAGTPLRFRWQPGQTLTYRVIQNTTVQETAPDEKGGQPEHLPETEDIQQLQQADARHQRGQNQRAH